MPNTRFKVIPPRVSVPTSTRKPFVLQQDNWNDYSFQTQYQLYFIQKSDKDEREESLIGSVKILKRGQTKADSWQITSDFDELGPQYCSVGESLDYYQRLNELDPELSADVLRALNDVVRSPKLVDEFSTEEGWETSLFRGHQDGGAEFRTMASGLLTGNYTSLPTDGLRFAFQIPGWLQPAKFDFGTPDSQSRTYFPSDDSLGLPGRISVVVGANGSGKSTLLARLARVAFGTVPQRSQKSLEDVGVIEPSGLGFPRIISIAFSPFDSFRLPGLDQKNRKQFARDISRGVGRYIFIGLRDISAEYSADSSSGVKEGLEASELFSDRVGTTHLKSIGKLVDEFSSHLEKISQKDRSDQFWDVCRTLLQDSQSQPFYELIGGDNREDGAARSAFLASSTGHKIVLLIVSGLLANIEPRSLILIDEPETHLHPPLLAAVMHALRAILRSQDAFAVVATHSPVVVQESLARHVSVVRRDGGVTVVSPSSIETFGESIGLITAEVFRLQSEATDFHKILDHLVEELGDLESIENLFLEGSMSHQGRGYVLSRLAERGRK